MKRRDFLKVTGAFAAQLIGNSIVLTPALLSRAQASTGLPLDSLRSLIADGDALFLVPGDTDFAKYNISMNLRTNLTPQLRILCKTADAVSAVISWARTNSVSFSVRGGGHSYEGLSQSTSVVIDGRAMRSIEVSDDASLVYVGAGAALGDVYHALAPHGRAIPAGSCPTVGVAGHTQGGGFGLLARPFGLACDSLKSIEVVDAQGRILNASATENSELFWALRGGGGGSFGVATRFVFQTHEVAQVSTLGVSWVLPVERALRVMKAWQAWAPKSPDAITTIFRVGKSSTGQIALRCAGQSTGSEASLRAELAKWINIEAPTSFSTSTLSFIDAVAHFAGGEAYETIFMKGKSDYLFQPMSDDGITTLMHGLIALPTGAVVAICDSYGGAVGRVAADATAFSHRAALYSIQYYSQWGRASDSAVRIGYSRQLYDSMRPYVSGQAYVNYCDIDLVDYAKAYWSDNLPRLSELKSKFDPDNVFKHAQSVPGRR
jgi:FAD/FMN-containing dehydrogenase